MKAAQINSKNKRSTFLRAIALWAWHVCICGTGQAQKAPAYGRLDTLATYAVTLQAETGPGYARYYVNGAEVRKVVYEGYKKFWDNVARCKPCYLKTYDEDDNLISEAVQYTDCVVGSYTAYHRNGRVKEKGQYRENRSGDWKNIFARGYCRPTGRWTHYDEEGKPVRTETFPEPAD